MRFGRKKSLMDRAHDYVEQVAETVIPTLESALDQTREKAGPALADARERAKPLIEEGKARAAEGRDLAAAKVAELKGEPEPAKGGKVKKVLFIGGLLAIAGLVFKKLTARPDSANWQASYVPSPPPAPKAPEASTPAAAPIASVPPLGNPADPLPTDAADDAAGGAPGEALSDAAEEPHAATSPDAPADVIDVADVPTDK